MNRLHTFIVLLLAAVSGLTVSLAVLTTFHQPPPTSGMMGGMMEGMMGPFAGQHPMRPQPPIVLQWLPWTFTALLAAAVAGVIYFALLPEIKSAEGSTPASAESAQLNLQAVLRALKDDERQVVGFLRQHGGVSLQKDIRWKLGLTRLKTHRIVARLAERGIVSVRPHGKTNEITLAEWLKSADEDAPRRMQK